MPPAERYASWRDEDERWPRGFMATHCGTRVGGRGGGRDALIMVTNTTDSVGAALGAGGKIVQMIQPVILTLIRKDDILHLRFAHMPNKGMCAPPAAAARGVALPRPPHDTYHR